MVRIAELVDKVAEAGMPAVAITDQNNLFAMVKFYRAAMSKGVKPIIGVDLTVAESDARSAPTRIALLCQNEAGYRNLTRIVTRLPRGAAARRAAHRAQLARCGGHDGSDRAVLRGGG